MLKISEKLIWRFEITCTDPNVVGNRIKEKKLIKEFEKFKKAWDNTIGKTPSARTGLLVSKSSIIRD